MIVNEIINGQNIEFSLEAKPILRKDKSIDFISILLTCNETKGTHADINQKMLEHLVKKELSQKYPNHSITIYVFNPIIITDENIELTANVIFNP